jgi:hypothetical protein
MTRVPKSVRQLLKSKPALKQLELEISAQKALLSDIRRHLSGELAPHCLGAQIKRDRLVLHTDSPVWATRLRYSAPQLASLLQETHPGLREIKVRVLISRQPRRTRCPSAHHSDVAANIVRSSAGDIEQPQLREAMMRLSRVLRR